MDIRPIGSDISWVTMDPDDAQTLLDRIGALRHPCDLDLLIFFVKHPNTLMASEQLASFMGYDVKQLSESLDVLLGAGLVTRSQNRGQIARMYSLAGTSVHGGWLPSLVALASTRTGRLALLRTLKERPSTRTSGPFLVRPKADRAGTPDRRSRRRGTE